MTNLVDRLRAFPGGVGAEALCREAATELEQYKTWSERDSRSLSIAINDLSLERVCKQDRLSQIERQKGQIERLRAALEEITLQNGEEARWTAERALKGSDHEPSAELRCCCGELKIWAHTTKIETATSVHYPDRPCHQRNDLKEPRPQADPGNVLKGIADTDWDSSERT